MQRHLLILHITNEQISFNDEEHLAWDQTNFPKKAVSFRTHEPIYWLVEMLRYEAKTGLLEVELVDYETDEEDLVAYYQQKMKRPVSSLNFAPMAEDELRTQLSYFDPAGLASILSPEVEEP
ncbi:MAG: hypothetical protein AAGF87_14625, partial [Bacteroidota bacterium]